MKTLLHTALALCLLSTTAFAQDDFKPLAGARNLEVQIDPFSSGPIGLTSGGFLGGIKYRQFSTPTMAYRIIGNLSFSSTSQVTQDAGTNGSSRPELTTSNSSFYFGVRPGVEKHFAGTKHLSPYIGAELAIGLRTTSQTVQDTDGESNTVYDTKTSNKGGGLTFGLGGLAGVDIYLIKHFYIGTELGYGLSYYSPFVTKITPPQGDVVESKRDQSSAFSIAPWLQSSIRVGFIF